jgi:hypothetical protein
MQTSIVQLTPELRQALLAHPDEPLYIADHETQKVYVLVEQGRFPALEEDYVASGLELAREQIARGKTSQASIEDIIAEAQRRHASAT